MSGLRARPPRRTPITTPAPTHCGLSCNPTTSQLTMVGAGATVGTGVVFVLHEAVPGAVPAVVLSISSVTLVTVHGQTRILFATGRDGPRPASFARAHPRLRTPVRTTVGVGGFVPSPAGLVPLDALRDLVPIGTLVASTTVSVGVVVLRRARPGILSGLPRSPYAWCCAWLAVVLAVHLLRGRHHSTLDEVDLTAGSVKEVA